MLYVALFFRILEIRFFLLKKFLFYGIIQLDVYLLNKVFGIQMRCGYEGIVFKYASFRITGKPRNN